MTGFINCKVCVKLTDNEELEGVVTSVEPNKKRMSLEKVVTSKGVHLPGLQHFYGHEVADVTILDSKVVSSEHPVSYKRERGSRLLVRKSIPRHLAQLKHSSQEDFLLRNLGAKGSVKTLKEDAKSSDYESSSEQEYSSDSKYCVLTKMNELFYKAITHISSQKLIAVALEGVCLGRNGKLCWIQIGTEEEIFLFDLVNLGDSAIEDGLKPILENGEIQKIMHDCRLPSDFFEHQHSLQIVNVFDTQVAAAFVYRLFNYGNWPRYVPGLAACLLEHLSISPDQVNQFRIRENMKKEDQGVWAERPAKAQILEAAARNVMYLFELRSVLMEKMLSEFAAGVDVYLQYARDASKDDAMKYQNSSHLLPLAFQQLPLIIKSQTNYMYHDQRKNGKTREDQGFWDNCDGIRDPGLRYIKDSVWHNSERKCESNASNSKSAEEKSPQQNRPNRLNKEMKMDTKVQTVVDTEVTNKIEHTLGTELNIPVMMNMSEELKRSPRMTVTVENKDLSISKSRTVNNVLEIEHMTDSYDREEDCTLHEENQIIVDDKRSYGEEKIENQLTGTKLMRKLIEQNSGSTSDMPDNDKLKDFVILPAGSSTRYSKKNKKFMQPVKAIHRSSEGDYQSSEHEKEKREQRRRSSGDQLAKSISEVAEVDVPTLDRRLYVDAPQELHMSHISKTENISETRISKFAMEKLNGENMLQNISFLENGFSNKQDDLPIPSVKEESVYFENASPIGTHIRVHSYERKGKDFPIDKHNFSPVKEQCDTNLSGTSSYGLTRSCSPLSPPLSNKVQNAVSGSIPCSQQLKSSLLGKWNRSSMDSMVYNNNFSSPDSTEKTQGKKGFPTEISSPSSSQPTPTKEISLLQKLFDVLGMNN